jgi:hypothetical protein
MKGHLKQRSPNHWAIVIDLRDTVTGKRKRKWHSFAGTKRAAQAECARLIHELKSGAYVEPAKETLAKFLDRWLAEIKARVSPRTYDRYAEIARKNIVPAPNISRPPTRARWRADGARMARAFRLARSCTFIAF